MIAEPELVTAVRQPGDQDRRRARAWPIGDPARAWADVEVFLEPVGQLPFVLDLSGAGRWCRSRTGSRHRPTGRRLGCSGSGHTSRPRARSITIAAFWQPLISAELADTADGWRTALQALEGSRRRRIWLRTPDSGSASTWSPPASGRRPRRCWPSADRAGHGARGRAAGRSAERSEPAGRVGAGAGRRAHRRLRTDPARDRSAATGRRRPIQRGDRLRSVHQHQDGQRPRLQHLGQARRQRPRRGRRRRPPPRPRLLT